MKWTTTRVPVNSAGREIVEAGGLISSVPSYAFMNRQTLDLPINLRTARALGLHPLPMLLARADAVSE